MTRHGNLENSSIRSPKLTSASHSILQLALTGSFVIPPDGPTMCFLDPGAADRTVFLPVITPAAGQEYFIANLSTTKNLNVVTSGGVTVQTILPSSAAVLISSISAWKVLASLSAAAITFLASLISNTPIFILATGQSNMVQNQGTALSSPANAFVWNNTVGTDGANGTAFVALNTRSAFTNADAFAIQVARANPTRNVYVLDVAFGSQTIAHWMVGAPAPDAYANITANINLALAAAGATKIDVLLWWQGENQTATPETYVTDFNTVMDRFKAETWFPRGTQVIIYGLMPESFTANALLQKTDTTNSRLQEAVQFEPDTRRFIYTGTIPASYWDASLHLGPNGVREVALLAYHAYEHGQSINSLLNPMTHNVRAQIYGRPANRNLLYGGDLTANPWRYGETFTGPANNAQITDDFKWITSGAGIVDIKKTADAPTLAQAGVFTQHCLHVDVTTADNDLSTITDYYGLMAEIPALNTGFLGFGQTAANSITISFWVKSTIVGNYFVALQNSAQDRYYNTQYTINAADTWEKKVISIPGDVTGTWLYTSGVGIRAFFTIASGDTYLFGPDVWAAGDVRVGNVTRANGMSSSSNNFKLALVQIEEGRDPSVFARMPGVLLSNGFDRQPAALAVKNSGDTNDSSSGSGAYVVHNLNYVLPANRLDAGKALRITAAFRITTGGTAPVLHIQLRAGSVVLAQHDPAASSNNLTNNQAALSWIVQAIDAVGAAANVECAALGNSNALGGSTVANVTDMPVALATNATLQFQVATQFDTAGVGTNTIKLSQFTVEPMN